MVDPHGRFLFVKGCLADNKVTNVYVPNSGQIEFIQNTLEKLESFKEGDLLLGGDFNLIMDGMKDRSRFATQKPPKKIQATLNILPPVISKFASLMESYNLVDIWRVQHELEKDYTYYLSYHNVYTRIDLMFVSSNFLKYSPSSAIGYKIWTDHNWLEFTFMFP